MKIKLEDIKKQLEDSFFELKHLGKEAIRQHTISMEKYTAFPANLQFVDWKPEDAQQVILYSFADTNIGRLLIANTPKGICFLGFAGENDASIINDLQNRFPQQQFEEQLTDLQKSAADYCNGNHKQTILLHLKGTVFQLDIWKKLTRIPEGKLSTYGSLSDDLKAAQAVGNAVGSNPVSYIIPCHRIVKSDGNLHGYHWGTDIKKQLLAYELQNY